MADVDYKMLCWKLVDKMNDAWRKKTGKSEYYCSFEFMPANELYLYSSGLVAQIVFMTEFPLMAIVSSDIGGIVTKGCETPEEAFKSMIENYLKKVNDNGWFVNGWFGELDVADLPKTIEEIAA